jgi:hypothetical protein
MEQSNENEICEKKFNDVPMEEMFENHPILETNNSIILENEK